MLAGEGIGKESGERFGALDLSPPSRREDAVNFRARERFSRRITVN